MLITKYLIINLKKCLNNITPVYQLIMLEVIVNT